MHALSGVSRTGCWRFLGIVCYGVLCRAKPTDAQLTNWEAMSQAISAPRAVHFQVWCRWGFSAEASGVRGGAL